MYAVVKSGGHQYRVQQGDLVEVDLIQGEPGTSVTLDKVLMLGGGDKVSAGKPFISGASVKATIKSQERAEKVLIFKYRRRKNSKKIQGHRQSYTVLEINGIQA